MLDTGCCGTNLRTNKISYIGYLTFAFPSLVVLSIIYPALFLGPRSLRVKVRVIITGLFNVSKKMVVFPKLKLGISTSLYPLSPSLSGLAFKTFNLFTVFLCWGLMLGLGVGLKHVL